MDLEKSALNTKLNCHQTSSVLKNSLPVIDNLPTITVDLKDKWERSEDKDPNWTSEDADRAIQRYCQFLYLANKYQDMPLAPTKDIDAIWHLHLLSPVAYYNDCINYLGTLFDHDGGFGQKESEIDQLKNTFYKTEAAWKKEFNQDYVINKKEAMTDCWHDCEGRCWHACKSITVEEVVH